jgi:flagellar biosynthesis regulator FlaF
MYAGIMAESRNPQDTSRALLSSAAYNKKVWVSFRTKTILVP